MGESGSWSVGELAAAAGVSVRVLRHWDALGVVSPTRTAEDDGTFHYTFFRATGRAPS